MKVGDLMRPSPEARKYAGWVWQAEKQALLTRRKVECTEPAVYFDGETIPVRLC